MIFNTNNCVLVRLTPMGRAFHKKAHEQMVGARGIDLPYRAPQEDAEGWSKWQLWQLMHDFGPLMYLGGEAPFNTDITIPEKSA